MASKSVLVIATSEDCHHCNKLKKGPYNGIKEAINARGDVKIEEIVKKSMDDPLDKKYPSALSNYVSWYPTVILISGDSWNNGIPDSKGVKIMNGFVGGHGRAEYGGSGPKYSLDVAGVSSWVKNSLAEMPSGSLSKGTIADTTFSGPIYLLPSAPKETTLTSLYSSLTKMGGIQS